MSNLAVMAGMPVKVVVGDETYLVSPMTLGDWAVMEEWAQEQFFADMKKRMELVADDSIKKLIQSRLATLSHREIMKESSPYMDDGEGTARCLHLMLKHKQAAMTLEKARDLVGFREVNRARRLLLGLTAEPTEEEKEETKKEAESKSPPIES